MPSRPVRLAALLAALLLAAPPVLAECRGTDWLAEAQRSAPEVRRTLERAVRGVPFAEGILWRIEKAGRVSFAFGTFHSTRPDIAAVPEGLRRLLEGSRVLVVEVAREEQDRLSQLLGANPDLVMDRSGQRLSRNLSREEMDTLARLVAPYGMNRQAVEQLRPWFLNLLLSIPACEIAEVAKGAKVLDDNVMEAAEASGLPVLGLETAEVVLGVFQGFRPADQIRLLKLNIAFGEISEDIAASMARLYRDEQIWTIWALNRLIAEELGDGRATMRMMEDFYRLALADRNRNWLPRLLPELERGGALVAVGALHLAGPDSLQALLEKRGFTVTRAALTDVAPPRPEPAPEARPAPEATPAPETPAMPEVSATPAPETLPAPEGTTEPVPEATTEPGPEATTEPVPEATPAPAAPVAEAPAAPEAAPAPGETLLKKRK